MDSILAPPPINTTYHYIVRDAKICDGKPIIKGTRIRVAQIAIEYERLGQTPDQIAEGHPHLTLSQIHEALAYYYDHQASVDADIIAGERFVRQLRQHYPSKLNLLHDH